MSTRALVTLSDALRHRRAQVGTRWRRLSVGEQALLVVAHLRRARLRKGETYTDLAAGFGVGTTTVFRYITEAIEVLATLAPTLRKAVETAVRKAFVILDGTLLRATAPAAVRRDPAEPATPKINQHAAARKAGPARRGRRVDSPWSPARAPGAQPAARTCLW